MSSSATIYIFRQSPRSAVFAPLIKFLGLDVEICYEQTPHFLEAFPLHKKPAFESEEGWKLHEALAVMEYLTTLAPESCSYNFWGKTAKERAKVWQWLSFVNTDSFSTMIAFKYTAKTEEEKVKALDVVNKVCQDYENQLEKTRFLAGDEQTLADAFAVNYVSWGIDSPFTKGWFGEHPALWRWFQEVTETNPIMSSVLKGQAPSK